MAEIWFGSDMAVKLSNNLTLKTDILKKYFNATLSDEDISRSKLLFSPSMVKLFKDNIKVRSKLENNLKKKTKQETAEKFKKLKFLSDTSKYMKDELYMKQSEFYDGSKFSKNYDGEIKVDINSKSKKLHLSKKGENIGIKNTLKSSSIKLPESSEEEKAGFLPDSYGITIYLSNGRAQAFRNAKEVKEFLRKLPNDSIFKIIFYGHGSPGLQTVGNYDVDSQEAERILKGKMANKGIVEFHGCNTASIGTEISLNPLVGSSMLLRRLLYFSIPYFTDRLNGVDKKQARQTWESRWNEDLARETSYKLNNVIVCGYSTFGLVPERLYGKPKATPGFTIGKKVCYFNGEKVKLE